MSTSNVPDILRESPPQTLAGGPHGIHQYLQRAAELYRVDPVVSYWTAYYAAEIALAQPRASPVTQTYLIRLLDHLESTKTELSKEHDRLLNDSERARDYILAFALKVFKSADDEDRAGKASKRTAKTFLAASHFLSVLKIWAEKEDDRDADVLEKIRYAKWKATDIVKAIKEGRQPVIGDGSEVLGTEIDLALEEELKQMQLGSNQDKPMVEPDRFYEKSPSYPFPLASQWPSSLAPTPTLPPLSPSQQPGAPAGTPNPDHSSMSIHSQAPVNSPARHSYPSVGTKRDYPTTPPQLPPAPLGTPSPDPTSMRPNPRADLANSFSVTAPSQPPTNGVFTEPRPSAPEAQLQPAYAEYQMSTPRSTSKTEDILMEPYTYLASVPGKDIRSRLIEAFDIWLQVPSDRLAIIKQVVEMLHTASLLMDDVEDNSDLRRGIPVAHKIYGVAQTINSANFVYFKAIEAIDRLGRPDYHVMIIEELLNLHRGQGLDLFWRDTLTCPTEQEYLDMVSNKTGGLFRIALKLLMAEATQPAPVDYLSLVNQIGIYFQIRDDYMNLRSEAYTSNKGFAEDLTEGKFSFPIIHAVRSDPSNRQILNILKQHPTDSSVKEYAVQLMTKYGSFAYTLDVLSSLDTQCRTDIQSMGGNALLDGILDALALSPEIASPMAHPLALRTPVMAPRQPINLSALVTAPSYRMNDNEVHRPAKQPSPIAKPQPQPQPRPVEPLEMTSKSIATTQKHAKTVISALEYEDLSTARRELEAALELVTRMGG